MQIQNNFVQMQAVASIFLDTRRILENGKYPVKLRIYHCTSKKAKLYSTIFTYSEIEFQSIFETTKPRSEYKQRREQLVKLEARAKNVIDEMNYFSFEDFEKKMYRRADDGQNVFYQYDVTIQKLKENNQLGTASNYQLSQKSIQEFIKYRKGSIPKKLNFIEVTPGFLTKYESYMIHTLQRSRTTVSMYLRALRTIFNMAITEKEIEAEIYPFGDPKKGKYQIPAVNNVKKSLSKEQLKQLFTSDPQTSEQAKAKDFWFFSYSCNGINIKDIALLKYENLQEGKMIIYRAKTINTSKGKLKPIVIHLTDFAKNVIEKYGNEYKSPKQFVFPVLAEHQSGEAQHTKVKNFTRFINQNFKKYAVSIGITAEISTYWARHSFATNAIRSGASMEFVSEALNHSNMKTTQSYFAGFADESKKEFMENMMNF